MNANNSIVLIDQQPNKGDRIFQIKEIINTTKYHIGSYLSEDQVNHLIELGVEVKIVSNWLP